MKSIENKLRIAVFFGFIAIMALGYICLPTQEYSALEKRYLEQVPQWSLDALLSGEFSEAVEDYMADQLPGRSFFVGLNAYFERATLRQADKEIYVAEDDRLVEAPTQYDAAVTEKNMAAINRFAEKLSQNVSLALILSGGWVAQEKIAQISKRYNDAEMIDAVYQMAGEKVSAITLSDVFSGRVDLYFKTDHHWTNEGAYYGSRCILEHFGRQAAPAESFRRIDGGTFRGSNYSRSCLWLTPAETITFWSSASQLTVSNAESDEIHEGVFYWENLECDDKYTVNLDGNHSLVRITNPEGKGSILVVRDSFSNSMGAFLAESYETVLLVDLRYYKGVVSELAASEKIDDVLICYSLSNFMTDVNLVWLR